MSEEPAADLSVAAQGRDGRATGRPVPAALDVDGIGVVALGTVLWGIALVVALVLHDSLRRHGHTWWIAAAGCGFGLGLLGIGYCRRRIGRRS